MLVLLFGLLGGGLFYSMRGPSTGVVNLVEEKACNTPTVSVDPSNACSNPGTYHDFRYICGNGMEGYLGFEEPHCLTIEQATEEISEYCRVSCS